MKFASEIQGFLGRLESRKQAYWNLTSCFEWNELLQPTILSFLCSHLDISLTTEINSLLAETNVASADVAENLMPKSGEEDADSCLMNLIEALKVAKEEARKNAEEEALLKGEKAKKKAEDEAKAEKEED